MRRGASLLLPTQASRTACTRCVLTDLVFDGMHPELTFKAPLGETMKPRQRSRVFTVFSVSVSLQAEPAALHARPVLTSIQQSGHYKQLFYLCLSLGSSKPAAPTPAQEHHPPSSFRLFCQQPQPHHRQPAALCRAQRAVHPPSLTGQSDAQFHRSLSAFWVCYTVFVVSRAVT